MMPLVSGRFDGLAQVPAGQPRIRQRCHQRQYHNVPPETAAFFPIWRLCARKRRLVPSWVAAPEGLDLVRHHGKVGLAAVGVDADHLLAAAGQAKLIEARPGEADRLGSGRLLQRERTLTVRVDDLDAKVAGESLLVGGPQFEQRIDLSRAGGPPSTREI